jgi:ribonuclease Z
MRPLLHPHLVNGRSGDPAVYVEMQFERRAILFDLGDITALTPRHILRLDAVFVSHTHIDHFYGFDRLLRVLVGREKTVHLFGPADFIGHVEHKLSAYRWNLVDRYLSDLVFFVTELEPASTLRLARFRLKGGFAREPLGEQPAADGTIHRTTGYRVAASVLEHRTPSLSFALQETAHINVWKNRLTELGLPVGSWLRALKQAVAADQPDDTPIIVGRSAAGEAETLPLGVLRPAVTVTPGQKIAYVTDVADTAANRRAIIELGRNADLLFIEAAFAAADAHLAAERAHLTTTAAGEIARLAGVRRVEPFHFSARYGGEETTLLREVAAAFAGPHEPHPTPP